MPPATAAAEGASSTAYPWGRGASAIRVQYIYDSANFAGVIGPMVITRMRWRANGTTVLNAGGTYGSATVDLSTAAVDHAAAGTTFASNHGADQVQVHNGAITVQATVGTIPNNWYVDIPLTSTFTYDPAVGDLMVDVACDNTTFAGVTPTAVDCATTGSLTSRVYNLTSHTATTGTFQNNVGPTLEITYVQNGLFANFTSDVTGGPTPLTVNFTDTSFSSDPGGVTSWAWDFENDGIVDSTAQNPTHTYTSCGSYTVALTVTDAVNPSSTSTRPGYITTDAVTVDFTYQVLLADTVQFTDTTTPAATSWAWDLDDDAIVDSTVQNPLHVYPPGTLSANVTLTASRLCGPPDAETKSIVPQFAIATTQVGGNGLSATGAGNVFDVTVHNPLGVNITSLIVSPLTTTGGAVTCDIYLTDEPGGYLANHTNGAVWRLVGTGSGTAQVSSSTAPVPIPMTLNQRIYIPSGAYSMAIHMNGSGIVYTNGNTTNQTVGNADLTLTLGVGKGAPFNSTANNPRVWNGILFYDVCNVGGLSGYGFLTQGCAGTLGVSTLTPTSLPSLGTTLNVDVDNLQTNAAIMLLGFSRTSSTFGPLPLDLGPFGAPGCFANVSNQASALILGALGTATWSLPIPNDPLFLCLRLYNQALVIDPGVNSLGGVTSDAGAMIIGN